MPLATQSPHRSKKASIIVSKTWSEKFTFIKIAKYWTYFRREKEEFSFFLSIARSIAISKKGEFSRVFVWTQISRRGHQPQGGHLQGHRQERRQRPEASKLREASKGDLFGGPATRLPRRRGLHLHPQVSTWGQQQQQQQQECPGLKECRGLHSGRSRDQVPRFLF